MDAIGAVDRPARQASTDLYLLRHPWENWLKVGVTNNMKTRLGMYRTSWGREPVKPPVIADAEMIYALGFDSAREMEAKILAVFADDFVWGEWLRRSLVLDDLESSVEAKDFRAIQSVLKMGRVHYAAA